MLEILIQSNCIPTCFNGGLHHHQGSPTCTNQNAAIVSCLLYHAHTDSLCVPISTVLGKHRCTALLKLSGTMEIQKAGVGICTIVGMYRYVCVCVCVYVRVCALMCTCVNEWVHLPECVHVHVCDCYTDKLHCNMFQWWTPPSSGQSHLHDTKHHYCKLSILSCKHRFTSCPHAYHVHILCPTKIKWPEISYIPLQKWHDVQLPT
jgi:hypothetical protein